MVLKQQLRLKEASMKAIQQVWLIPFKINFSSYLLSSSYVWFSPYIRDLSEDDNLNYTDLSPFEP